MSDALIIFAKNPVLGKTKTRIGKRLGDSVALAVYYQLINRAQEVTSSLPSDKFVYYSDFVDREDSWDNSMYSKRKQHGSDLGKRMLSAIEECLNEGYEKVVLIGTDIYALSSSIIEEAFSSLERRDIVLGPAEDGGYYLIGMKAVQPSLFNISQWSTTTVLKETLSQAENIGCSYDLLTALNDIDEVEDLINTPLEGFIKRKSPQK